jgi:glucokinase
MTEENPPAESQSIYGGLDIGGTKIALGLVDSDGNVLAESAFPTADYSVLKDAVQRISVEFTELCSQTNRPINSLGIGCTGQMDPEKGEILNLEYFPDWRGPGLVQGLSQNLGVPVRLANDAEAAALGEWAFGAGRNARTFVMVTVGTGIGVAVLQEGRLWRGVGGAHPEIGHHLLDPSGPACFCGLHGCWESLAGGVAMETWAQSQHPQRVFHTAREWCELARQEDSFALQVIARTAHYLGLGLSNLVTIFAPDVICLAGGLMESAPLFLPTIQEKIDHGCKLVPAQQVDLRLARLGSGAVMVGATLLHSIRNQE